MSGLPVSPLSEIFGGSSSADLIVFLVYNHDRDFSVQDMADRMKVSKAKVSKMKEGLLKYGVIKETRKVGKVAHYRYDRSSRYGKLLYDLVFTAHAPPDRTQPMTPVARAAGSQEQGQGRGRQNHHRLSMEHGGH